MKKILAILMVLVLCVSLFACNGNNSEDDVTRKIEIEVKNRAALEVKYNYQDVKTQTVTCFIEEPNEESIYYAVSGKVTVVDKYGDTYTGKYDAEVSYDEAEDSASIISFKLDNLYKDD